MATNWTDEQKKVLEAEGNIIVSAAAGSGKTAVLTERIVQKVMSGTTLDRMLVVTFTKAAAAEMKHRIEKELLQRSKDEKDAQMRMYLYEQSTLASRANISTLHSFCTYALRRNFYEAGISPAFRVGDEAELSELLSASADEALEKLYGTDRDTLSLPIVFGKEQKLIETALELLKKLWCRSDGRARLHEAVEKYNMTAEELEKETVTAELMSLAYENVFMAYKCMEQARDFCENEKQEDRLHECIAHLTSIVNGCKNYSDFAEKLKMPFTAFSHIGKLNPEFAARKDEAVSLYKEAAKIAVDLSDAAEALKKTYPYMRMFEELVCSIDDIFAAKKKKLGLIDYSDMELCTAKILSDESTAKEYRDRFDFIFVDEYQDINPLQDEIIGKLISGNNAFFVGDVKQSIYRFRNAKPDIFIRKLDDYDKDKNSVRLDLAANFRSSDAVINFVNSVFTSIMTKNTCGIDYNERARLVKRGGAGKGKVMLDCIDMSAFSKENSSQDDDLNEILEEEVQAKHTVRRIKELLNTTFYDAKNKVERNYTYSDFAIIMRSTKTKGEAFIRELLLAGKPVYSKNSDGCFEAIETEIFINLLRIIDNRRQDIPLLCVMRSVIGGFDLNEITNMRCMTDEEATDGKLRDVLDMLIFASENGVDKAKNFLEKLKKWRETAEIMPISEFVKMLLIQTGYYNFISVLPSGKHRVANLDRIVNLAKNYEKAENAGVYGFLRYLEKVREKTDVLKPEAAEANAVSLLTMHTSKGLEYNVVIIPGMEKSIMPGIRSPRGEIILFDDSPLLGTKIQSSGDDTSNIFYESLVQREKRAVYADEMRILYVAFTRARDTLILIFSDKNGESFKKAFAEPQMREVAVMGSGLRYRDWIFMSLHLCGKDDFIMEAAEKGEAVSDELIFSATPAYVYQMPEQDIDIQYFNTVMQRIAEIPTEAENAKMNRHYAHTDATKLMSKGSVTGFAKALSELQISARTAAVSENKTGVSAVQRGSATHLVFEKIPLCEHTYADVCEFIRRLQLRGFLSDREAASLNKRGIAAFFERPLYARMLHSEKVLREREFTCMVEAKRLLADSDSDELIMVQGVIDCCFMENGKWILLDYKTDSVNPNDEELLRTQAQTHAKQLELYAHVLEKISGIEVQECYICFVNAHDVQVKICRS
ncbi:MAG: UvrD-helicase domain-containing protein [Clostridia bacterium]|nr:UvrD-helicase domain-containing protein [Clostridia bacterium]